MYLPIQRTKNQRLLIMIVLDYFYFNIFYIISNLYNYVFFKDDIIMFLKFIIIKEILLLYISQQIWARLF
jgi:hypothetical protein